MVRFRTGTSPPVLILRAWLRGEFKVFISDWLLDEVARTISKPYFQAHVDPEFSLAIIEALKNKAIGISPSEGFVGIATHPEDGLVLSTAISAAADYL